MPIRFSAFSRRTFKRSSDWKVKGENPRGLASLDPATPVQTYAFGAFLSSEAARRAYWAACARFRDIARAARPNAAHAALATLQRAGYVSAIVTQNVDGLHQAAGAADVVEIHGTIGRCHCLACAMPSEWPVVVPWRSTDFRCAHCGGLLKPAVIAMGEEIPATAMRAAEAAVEGCGVLLVIGTQLAVSSAASLLAIARRSGAKIAIINIGAIAQPVGLDDVVLNCPAEKALAALMVLLGAGAPASLPARALLAPTDREISPLHPAA